MSSTKIASQTGPGRGQARRRRTADETRRLLLEAGTELALQSLSAREASAGGPLAHIRVQDVVKEASRLADATVTTGAAYNIWPSQAAFQVDLMFFLLEEGAYPSAARILELAAELFAARVSLDELGERLSDENFRIEAESPVARAARAFLALAGVPAVREALRAAHDSFLESGRVLYTQLLTYAGLRIREPYTLDQLITVMGALNEGLQGTYAVVPELFDVPKGAPSLVATASLAVFNSFCEPADEATPPATPPRARRRRTSASR